MKYTEVQEKVGVFADDKIKGEKCFTQLFTQDFVSSSFKSEIVGKEMKSRKTSTDKE